MYINDNTCTYVRATYVVLPFVLISVAMITDHPQSELAPVGGSLEFSCGYVLYADNPYLFAPHWYLDGRRLANNSVVNGTLVSITCDDANSTIRLGNLSVSLDGQTLQCRLESDFLDVTEKSNNATIMFSPTGIYVYRFH